RVEAALTLGTVFLLGWGVALLTWPSPRGSPRPAAASSSADMPAAPAAGLASAVRGDGKAPRWLADVERTLRQHADTSVKGGGPRVPASPSRGWGALLSIYAMGNRDAEFLACASSALRAGSAPGDILEALRLFPLSCRSDVLD